MCVCVSAVVCVCLWAPDAVIFFSGLVSVGIYVQPFGEFS